MKNLFTYIKQNKEVSFSTKDFTEVDVLMFSQLSYLDLRNLSFTNKQKYTLGEVSRSINRKKNKNIFLGEISVLKLLDVLAKSKRYRDIHIDYYEFFTNALTQCGAITILLPNHICFIAFEGTDLTISGWKEDAALAYQYPTEAQKKAGEYLTNRIREIRYTIHVCGHSKGGNLAIVGSMRTPIEERNRIVRIYSFDGPGLRESEFFSSPYQNIKNRIKHYIPEQSIIGVLFLQKSPIVIKSSSVGILQHGAFSWQVLEDYLERGRQNPLSKRLETSIAVWLRKYTLKEREEIVNNLFSVFLNAGITNLHQLSPTKIEAFLKILFSLDGLSEETKEVLFSFLQLLLEDVIKTGLLNLK